MSKLLFKNAGLVIKTTNKGLKVSIISKFVGESKTYYVTVNGEFNKDTDFEKMWNDCTPTWLAFVYQVENRGVNIYRTIKS